MKRPSVRIVLAGGAAVVVLTGGTAAALAAAGGPPGSGIVAGRDVATTSVVSAAAPALPGTVVDVTLSDMGVLMHGSAAGRYGYGGMMSGPGYGGMMSGGDYGQMMGGRGFDQMMGGGWRGRMMQVRLSRHTVPAGTVSLRVTDIGAMDHELVVLPLADGAQLGRRSVGADGTVDERGSLGEVSNNGGPGAGEGLHPGGTGWTTLHLRPGRYELLCNLPGHYAAGMFAELDVTK